MSDIEYPHTRIIISTFVLVFQDEDLDGDLMGDCLRTHSIFRGYQVSSGDILPTLLSISYIF